MQNILEDKKALRNRIKLLNKERITETLSKNASLSLLLELKPVIDKSASIAIYNASSREPSMSKVIEYALENKKLVYQPIAYLDTKFLKFEQIEKLSDSTIFFDKSYSVKNEEKIENIDLICIPLLAIDKEGYRLGKGGGYYDSTLENIYKNPMRKSIICGIGYSWQQVEKVPRDKWDLKLDMFCSEKGIYEF